MKLLTAAFLALFASSAVAQSDVPACAQKCLSTIPPRSSDCDDSDPTDVFEKCICSELSPNDPLIKCAQSTCSSSDLATYASTFPALCRAQLFNLQGQTSTSATSGKTGGTSTAASTPTSSPPSTTKTSSAGSSQTSASTTTSSSKGAAANQALPTMVIAGSFAAAVLVGI